MQQFGVCAPSVLFNTVCCVLACCLFPVSFSIETRSITRWRRAGPCLFLSEGRRGLFPLVLSDKSATQVSHQGFPVVTDRVFFSLHRHRLALLSCLHFSADVPCLCTQISHFSFQRLLSKINVFPHKHNRCGNNTSMSVLLNKDPALISHWHLLTLQWLLEIKNICSFAASLLPLRQCFFFSIKGPLTKSLVGKKEPWAKSLGAHEELHITVEQPCLRIYCISRVWCYQGNDCNIRKQQYANASVRQKSFPRIKCHCKKKISGLWKETKKKKKKRLNCDVQYFLKYSAPSLCSAKVEEVNTTLQQWSKTHLFSSLPKVIWDDLYHSQVCVRALSKALQPGGDICKAEPNS